MKIPLALARTNFFNLLGVALAVSSAAVAQTSPDGARIAPPIVAPTPTPAPPPLAQSYVASRPGVRVVQGRMLVPLSFLSNGLGASTGRVGDFTRIVYFGRTIEVYARQKGARVDGQATVLPIAPRVIGGQLYVPWRPFAQWLGVGWKLVEEKRRDASSLFLLRYPAAYVEQVRSTVSRERVRVVMQLSNPTRIIATQNKQNVRFQLAAARRADVPGILSIGDYMVARSVLESGGWRAKFGLKVNYAAPVRWFTVGNPPRLVVDVQRLFEEKNTRDVGGLGLTKIRKGTPDGPVQMYVVRVDPADGWRIRVAPAGYSVLQRNKTSKLAQLNRALVAVNGGFFAYDGAAVGAMMIDGQWIRLPWQGRTGIGFWPNGRAQIGNLQTQARVVFGSGMTIPIRDLNGWPDSGRVTALTHRFGNFYQLRAGEMALEVKDGLVVGKPGSGGVHIHANGFALVASGAARVWLDKALRGQRAVLKIDTVGWQGVRSALGGGPRLVENGRVQVTALRENFREDVRLGRGPRTAFGIDSRGRYIIVVVDGRQPYHSVGLTLTELAYTMQKFGAVNALNLDGGGSTAMAIKSRVVNRPSDGHERSVSNALLVMR